MIYEALTDDLITFVIQGPTIPTNKYSIDISTASVRALFPGSRVIISTWHGHPSLSACKPCGKSIIYRALDFQGVIRPGDDIEERLWRCRHCGTYSEWIRYVPLEGCERES